MEEKRRAKRRHLIYYLKVYDRSNDTLIGQVGDITTEGLMLVTEGPMASNLFFQLRLLLPDEIEGKHEISFDAKTMWCKKDINPKFFNVGLKLINIEAKHLEIIRNLIYDYSFQD